MFIELLITVPVLGRDFEYTYEGQTLTYTVLDHQARTCQTKEGSEKAPAHYITGDLIIPAVAKDGEIEYTVISIGDYSFADCKEMTSVTIPSSVISLGEYAFFRGWALSEMNISGSVTTIGKACFAGCSFSSVTIPNSVTTIEMSAFFQCPLLTSVTIPNSITEIKKLTFYQCQRFVSVTIPNSVVSIGESAFERCTGLLSLTIPESTKTIAYRAFKDCRNLERLSIPSSLTDIGDEAFFDCRALTEVEYSADIPIYGSTNVFDCYKKGPYIIGTLYVKPEALERAKNTLPWSLFRYKRTKDFSGIENVATDDDVSMPISVYNMNGIYVGENTDNLAPGIYIVRQGSNVRKISVQ